MANNNLIPVRSTEEARAKGRKGGIASGQARREKKKLKETMNTLLSMKTKGDRINSTLDAFGIPKEDQNYQTAMAVRLLENAISKGDTNAIRLIGEITGDLDRFGFGMDPAEDVIEMQYPAIIIPDNGRDKRDDFQLAPQAGPQTMFMASSADIVIYGGAAGGGKTFALLLEGLRHKNVPGFGAVIFRHNYNQITAQGGLWDASHKIFDQVPDAHSRKTPKLHWLFDSGAKLSFAHIERDDDLGSWQGTEIAYIGFDELTHFTKHQFFYMMSRNRSTCGVKPYIRATCNPDSDSWVAEFIKWWIDQDTGYPIPERSGRIRWMSHINDTIFWFDSREEGIRFCMEQGMDVEKAEVMTKSVTFISSKLSDNKILMKIDPGYEANLNALPEVDRERLLYGNWKIKPSAGRFFKRSQVNLIEALPDDIVMWCRAWDLAATDENENGDADYTSGVLMGIRKNGRIVIANVLNERIKAGEVEKLVLNTSIIDRGRFGFQYVIRMPQDPGQAGKVLAAQYVKLLSGFSIKVVPVSGSKELRATPLASQWQQGNVDVLIADWNDMYFSQMESFPESKHDDMVDASADSFNELTGDNFNIENLL